MQDETVQQLLNRLLPDFETTGVKLINNGTYIPQDKCIRQLDLTNEVEIEFVTGTGIPIQKVEILLPFQPYKFEEAVGLQQLWIRSPFNHRAQPKDFPKQWSLTRVAATFFVATNSVQTLLCLGNGKQIDPRLTVDDLPKETVLGIRACPLPGGAKGNPKQPIKTKIRNSLIEHGVPDSVVDARVEEICQAVGTQKLQKLDLDDTDQFWNELKKLASEERVRLVTATELKDYQKLKRANAKVKPQSSSDTPKGGPNRDKFKIPPLEDIVVCHQHFMAHDEGINIIPASRFGPDAVGLAIMGVKEATNHLGKGCISAEPLAILAIGHQVDRIGTKILIPGHTKQGEPLLLPGALLQFGEGNIEYKAAIPSTEAETIDAITMEFTIRRQHVGQWQATATPMHYLGLNCPELRGGKVISSWAVMTFDNSKMVPFHDATHWHGFLKVEFAVVPGVLRRSGQNGIFFTPKGQDKRPDQRFAVVALPTRKLEDILADIPSIDGALGVAVLNRDFSTFGIRCFREKVDKLREHFFPETAKIDTANVQADDNTFLLQNLQGQFTREGLNQALTAVGWNAQAIRQSGPQAWIIASQVEPHSQHLCINGSLAMVCQKKSSGTAALVMTRTDVTTTVNVHAKGTDITKHSRVDELRADLSHQVEAYMESKLSVANAQIQQLQHALEETKLQVQQSQVQVQHELEIIKADQTVTQKKMGDIETLVNANAGNIVSQMKDMLDMFHRDNGKQMEGIQTNIKAQLGGMHDDLSKRIEYIEREQGKRHKGDPDAQL